jgi:DNA-binding IscR family transcriptional regulator
MMNEGIISGQTGPMGGYVLAMPGSKLTVQRVADVTASIQIKKGRPSPESAAVAVRGYTKKFFMRIEEFFGKITIAELAQDLDLE